MHEEANLRDLPVLSEWVQSEPLNRLVWQIHIAAGNTSTPSPDNTHLTNGNRRKKFIEDVDAVSWCWPSDGERLTCLVRLHGVDDGCLSWAIAVEVF